MKVYTRQGDAGQTSLFNGKRVPKDHALVDAYGTVDECNSAIGLAASYLSQPLPTADQVLQFDQQTLLSRLQTVQQYLFDLGAHLATPRAASSAAKLAKTAFAAGAAPQLEAWIDDMDPKLAPLTTFVLPGGHPAAAALHLARTIARRAERAVTPLLLPQGADCASGQQQQEEIAAGSKAAGADVNGKLADGVATVALDAKAEEETAPAPEIDEAAYRFLNRLSDFLFVASRFTNRIMGCPDVTWCKPSTNGTGNA